MNKTGSDPDIVLYKINSPLSTQFKDDSFSFLGDLNCIFPPF